MDLNGDSTPDLDGTNVYFIGHSLGAIDGGTFAAIANADSATALKGVDLIAGGGGIVRLLDNSPAFAPRILGGLSAAAGLTTGDADLETYFNVLQATVDAGDPINFVNDWKNNAKPMLLTEFLGDQVVPNYPNSVSDPSTLPCWSSATQPSDLCGYSLNGIPERSAPLSGTEPLITNSGAQTMTSNAIFTASQPVWAVRLIKGSHTTPVLPQGDPGSQQLANETDAFKEIVGEAAMMIGANGAGTGVVSPSTGAVKTQ